MQSDDVHNQMTRNRPAYCLSFCILKMINVHYK